MWFALTAWLKGNLKWILGGLAGLLVIGAFFFMVHNLVNAGREIGQLRSSLSAEQKARAALETDYRALVNALEQEKRDAEQTAKVAEKLTKDITNASDQDRPAGPVLRRAIDSLRNTSAAASGN